MKNSRWFAFLGMAALAASPFCARAQSMPPKITVGYVDLVNSQIVAKDLGLVEKAVKVPVTWVKFDTGADVNRAAAAGEIDFASVGNPPAAIGIARGLPYIGIMSLDVVGKVEALVVRKDAHIDSVADLVGKRVATPFGTTSHYMLMTALKLAGVDASKVHILDLAPQAEHAAWDRKDIDAAYIWEPVQGAMVANGGKVLLDSAQMAAKGYPTWDVVVVTKSFASKYPAAVKAYVAAECQAIDYWNEHPQSTLQIISKSLSLPPAETQPMIAGLQEIPCGQQSGETYLGTPAHKGKFVDNLLSTAEFLAAAGRLPQAGDRATYAAFIDPGFLPAAH